LQVESSEPRHKEKDGKSSVWQVKSSNDGGSNGGGEIKKIKLCIVRPAETAELCPRRRKRCGIDFIFKQVAFHDRLCGLVVKSSWLQIQRSIPVATGFCEK
jgi:hypothetical protein